MDALVLSIFSLTLMAMTFPIYWITINAILEYLK